MKKLDLDLRSQITELGKAKTVRDRTSTRGEAEGDDEDQEGADKGDDDDRSEAGDGDADDEKRSRQKKEQTSYESDEEAEDVGPLDDPIEAEFAASESESGDREEAQKVEADDFEDQAEVVAELFTGNFHHATSFEFHESGCNIQLQVTVTLSIEPLHPAKIFFSLALISLNYFLSALSRRDVPENRYTGNTRHNGMFPSQRRCQGYRQGEHALEIILEFC